MTPAPDRAAAVRLKAALDKEIAFAPEIEDFVRRALEALESAPPDLRDVHASAVGQGVADVHLLVESILKRIAAAFEGVPSGAEWHKELLDGATLDLPGIRPPVLTEPTRGMLDELRRFRHVIRNIYGARIDPERARVLASLAPKALACFRADLDAFLRFLAALAQSARSDT